MNRVIYPHHFLILNIYVSSVCKGLLTPDHWHALDKPHNYDFIHVDDKILELLDNGTINVWVHWISPDIAHNVEQIISIFNEEIENLCSFHQARNKGNVSATILPLFEYITIN